MDKGYSKECWISIILRLAMVTLFGVAAANKFLGGLAGVVMHITGMFKDTWLPVPLVSLYARLLPWAEAAIAIWLLLGVRLKEAWIFTALVLVSLAFGMIVAKQPAADNYFYVLMACAGLYFSSYDKWNVNNWKKK